MKFKTTHEAYLQALKDVWFHPEVTSAPRGFPVREILNYTFTVTEPTSESIVTKDSDRNNVIASYTAKEKELYDSCSNKVEDFAKASKFWNQLANPDGTVNSAYGYLIWKNESHGSDFEQVLKECSMFGIAATEHEGRVSRMVPVRRTPWEWAKESLIQDKDTRQAILRFSLPEHQWMGNKDQTCTMHGNFLIRNDKLYLTIIMRSNDLMKGLVYDLPWFVSLMDKMVDELKPTYPNLTKGHYTHIVHSMHIYEKDGPAIIKMIGG
jgi:thymidylate synthase